MIFANISLSITEKSGSIFDLAIIQWAKESGCLTKNWNQVLLLAHVAEFWEQ
jgi:hypothetical protein